jgi:hypothetical protein
MPKGELSILQPHSLPERLHATEVTPREMLQNRPCMNKRSIQSRSRNHCCRGKAINIIYSEWVCVTLVIQNAKRMRCIISSPVTCLVASHFSTLSAHTNAQCLNSMSFYDASVSNFPLMSLKILSNHTFVNTLAKEGIENIPTKSNINGTWEYFGRNVSVSVFPHWLLLRRTPVSIFL